MSRIAGFSICVGIVGLASILAAIVLPVEWREVMMTAANLALPASVLLLIGYVLFAE